ncbi:MAG: 50S ribosomal protein L20 [Planctomycetota bacterium]|jgi:large subunit ribosomal protein L20
MPRVRKGAAARQAKKRVLKAVKGYRGAVRTQIRLAKEARLRAEVNARVGRRLKKRDYRSLWIIRLSAACKQRGMRYSQFISGCKKAGIEPRPDLTKSSNRSKQRCRKSKIRSLFRILLCVAPSGLARGLGVIAHRGLTHPG